MVQMDGVNPFHLSDGEEMPQIQRAAPIRLSSNGNGGGFTQGNMPSGGGGGDMSQPAVARRRRSMIPQQRPRVYPE